MTGATLPVTEAVAAELSSTVDVVPVTEIADPVTDVLDPVVDTVEPVTDVLDPVIDTVEPVTDVLDPVIDTVEPVTDVLDPVIDTVEPVTDVLDPVIDTVEPVTDVLDPVIDTVEPVTDVLDPVIDTVEPVTDVLDPVIDTLEPVVGTPITVVDADVPVLDLVEQSAGAEKGVAIGPPSRATPAPPRSPSTISTTFLGGRGAPGAGPVLPTTLQTASHGEVSQAPESAGSQPSRTADPALPPMSAPTPVAGSSSSVGSGHARGSVDLWSFDRFPLAARLAGSVVFPDDQRAPRAPFLEITTSPA